MSQKIVGAMLLKGESWCIKATIPAALEWCDELVIYDDFSTDNSQEIIQDFIKSYTNRIFYYRNLVEEEFWQEMFKREQLKEFTLLRKPDIFALVDADEILTVPLRRNIHLFLEQLKPNRVLAVPMGCPWNSLNEIRIDNCSWTNARWTTAIKLDYDNLPSWKPRQGYDHHNREAGLPMTFMKNKTSYNIHLQFANLPRRKAKHDWYMMTELIRWGDTRRESSAKALNVKYGEAFNEKGLKLATMPDYYFKEGEKELIDISSPGWYLDEIKKLFSKYGEEKFKELKLHYA